MVNSSIRGLAGHGQGFSVYNAHNIWSMLRQRCMQALPAYLRSEIVFAEAQRPKLLARIMEALGSLALRRARETGRHG